jgi:hypothetical protein
MVRWDSKVAIVVQLDAHFQKPLRGEASAFNQLQANHDGTLIASSELELPVTSCRESPSRSKASLGEFSDQSSWIPG